MTDEPVTWFHGLIAERTAEFCPDATQVPFLQREIALFGQPALDLGCGVGRLLLPLMHAGLDIDGCDIYPEMLRHCRDKAAAQGLEPRLYQQPMHALDIPRKYRTLYICASFNLAGSRENRLATLRRCFAHLQEGGALLLNIEPNYTVPEWWGQWEPAKCKTLPSHYNPCKQGTGLAMTAAEKRIAELLDRWLASVELHTGYLDLDDAAYAKVQDWPRHQRPTRWIVDLARSRLNELRRELVDRRAKGDTGYAESLELMAFLTTLLGSEHVDRFIPQAPERRVRARLQCPRLRQQPRRQGLPSARRRRSPTPPRGPPSRGRGPPRPPRQERGPQRQTSQPGPTRAPRPAFNAKAASAAARETSFVELFGEGADELVAEVADPATSRFYNRSGELGPVLPPARHAIGRSREHLPGAHGARRAGPGAGPGRVRPPATRGRGMVRGLVETALLALLVFLGVRASFQNFRVDGSSMFPTLANSEFLLVNKLVYSEIDMGKLGKFVPFIDAEEGEERFVFHGPHRGDIIVLRDPRRPEQDLIKRVVGLPGETVEIRNGQVFINDYRLEAPFPHGAPPRGGRCTGAGLEPLARQGRSARRARRDARRDAERSVERR